MDTSLKNMLMITMTVVIQQSLIVTAQSPVVTLSHGGQLRGFTAAFGTAEVDAFIGVRFAEPPVGNLRFKKPVEAKGWSGVVDANKTGNICFQATVNDGETVGSEDCLYLNIYKPADSKRRAVMMFIHGGGYVSGSANAYPGAPLAVTGDVIVITINYRLGAFGFLTDEQGNGNFGLWDQRAALRWIQRNIAAFGGDPQRVTIFGESAGAGSVSALMMSQQTDGLFARGILESGSLYQLWGWYSSKRDEQRKRKQIRQNTKCPKRTTNIFSCFAGMTTEQAFTASIYTTNLRELSWKPTDDNDFFPANISDEDYSPSQKYDVMAGFNGQEGTLFYMYLPFVYPDVNISDGLSQGFADRWLMDECGNYITPTSSALCQDFLKTQYWLKHSWNDRQRAIKMTYAMGEVNFNADIHRLIEKASEGNHSTYAYYFTHLLTSPLNLFGAPKPDWLRRSADHAEELPLVFGGPLLARENNSNVWLDIARTDPQGDTLVNSTYTKAERDLSVTMMTLWTNFAKSGNPNLPERLPWGMPRWPQYSKDNDVFLQLAASNTRLLRTPNKRRLEDVRKMVLSATRLHYIAENQQCTA